MKKIISTIILICVFAVTFTSCSINYYNYDDADKYVCGGGSIADNVKSIDIDWIAGNVEIKYHGDSNVLFYEDRADFGEEDSMYHYFDGSTLYIKFHKSGIHSGITRDKTLTLFVPQTVTLDELSLDLVSADLSINEVSVSTLEIETVSGDVSIVSSDDIDDVSIETVSGSIKGQFVGNIGDMDIDSTSGNVTLYFDKIPTDMAIETVSGDTTMYLPEDSGLKLYYESVSGDFDSELFFYVNGNCYTFGDGSATLDYESTSGDLSINKK